MSKHSKPEKPEPTECVGEGCDKMLEAKRVPHIRALVGDDECDDGGFWVEIEKCRECEKREDQARQKRARKNWIRKRIENANLPIRQVKADADLIPQAVEFLEQFGDEFDRPTKSGCFFTGSPGTGKTTQLVKAGIWWLRKKTDIAEQSDRDYEPVQYVTEADLLAHCRDFDSPDTVRRYLRPELLLVDELGRGKASEWSSDHYSRLLDKRYRELKPTIFASNWKPTELVDLVTYGAGGEEYRTYDERNVDRIVEMCGGRIFELTKDHRSEQ